MRIFTKLLGLTELVQKVTEVADKSEQVLQATTTVAEAMENVAEAMEKSFTSTSWFTGNVTNLITSGSMTVSAAKTGTRAIKTSRSFACGGWVNPATYANGISCVCSGASSGLLLASKYTGKAYPTMASTLWLSGVLAGTLADGIENVTSVFTYFGL